MSSEAENRYLMSLAKEAYDAYGDFRGWRAYDMADMPSWHELPDGIQLAWKESVKTVRAMVRSKEGGT